MASMGKKPGIFHRAGDMIERARNWMTEYAYLVTIMAVIAIIAASAMYTRHVREESGVQAAAGATEVSQKPEETKQPLPESTPMPTLAPLVPREMAVLSSAGAVMPVSGEVLRGFNEGVPVFWEALGCWQVHDGVDIAGKADEQVSCARDGVVRRTVRDDLWGWRVQVEQTDGSIAEYAGLAVCEVAPGQSVTRGQALGTLLSQIPCEAEEGSHLHLTLTMPNGKKADPLTMLPES